MIAVLGAADINTQPAACILAPKPVKDATA
jgi:hypothetical protein